MKYFYVLAIIFIFNHSVFTQEAEKRFSYSLEYSAAITNMTSDFPLFRQEYKMGGNVFAKAQYNLTPGVALTLGAGVISSREYQDFNVTGTDSLVRIEIHRLHNYLVFPVGIKFSFGSFFVHPEIGFGRNISRRTRQNFHFANGSNIESKPTANPDFFGYNEFFMPLMFTTGFEIPIGKFSILTGVKGYYALTELEGGTRPERHHYGFGIMAGIKY